MTLWKTDLGDIQIVTRKQPGQKRIIFRNPPSWALTGKAASELQEANWIHFGKCAHACLGLAGTDVIMGKKRVSMIAIATGMLRVGGQVAARAPLIVDVAVQKGVKFSVKPDNPSVRFSAEEIKAAITAAAALPRPSALSAEERKILRRAAKNYVTWQGFMQRFGAKALDGYTAYAQAISAKDAQLRAKLGAPVSPQLFRTSASNYAIQSSDLDTFF
jgi:hypothetical protein